jgi:hypothetical protein
LIGIEAGALFFREILAVEVGAQGRIERLPDVREELRKLGLWLAQAVAAEEHNGTTERRRRGRKKEGR